MFSHILLQKLLHAKARPQEHLTGLSHLLALSGYCLTSGFIFQQFSFNPSMILLAFTMGTDIQTGNSKVSKPQK